MPDTVINSHKPVSTSGILILKMKKLRLREVKDFAHGHTATEWWSHDLN